MSLEFSTVSNKLFGAQEELERAGIEPKYLNVAIYVEFVVAEGLVERLKLDDDSLEL